MPRYSADATKDPRLPEESVTHAPLISLPLTLGLLALAACGETTTPNQPTTANDKVSATPLVAAAGNFWTNRTPMPRIPVEMSTGRIGLAAGSAKNAAGRPILYAFGGISTDGEYRRWGNHAYDPATSTWVVSGGVPFGLSFTNGVGKIGNRLYISGGVFDPYFEREIVSTLYRYDPAADRGARRADMPRPTAEGITGVINGKLYVLAGLCINAGQEVDCRSLYRYDPATNTWATLPRAPHPHRGGVGGVINGKLYAVGGCCATGGFIGGVATAHLDVYDPATNTWKTRAPLPEARAHSAGAVLNGKLYVIGGNYSSTVFAYDPPTNTWIRRASIPKWYNDLAAAQVTLLTGQSRIFVLGGSEWPRPPNQMYTP